ncbi:MAG: hypothetical protein MUF33_14700, partial [Candidatus Nanopelagicales bacterium]|nr:hypothetical protein [Candidatus Nanopelagicales bacterium]
TVAVATAVLFDGLGSISGALADAVEVMVPASGARTTMASERVSARLTGPRLQFTTWPATEHPPADPDVDTICTAPSIRVESVAAGTGREEHRCEKSR